MNHNTGLTVIFVTTASSEEAQQISTALLQQRKAACVNVLSGVNSSFWWQDEIDSAQESLLIIKTKTSLLDEVIELVRQLHGYEVPEIIALPVIGGNRDYLEWVAQETK